MSLSLIVYYRKQGSANGRRRRKEAKPTNSANKEEPTNSANQKVFFSLMFHWMTFSSFFQTRAPTKN